MTWADCRRGTWALAVVILGGMVVDPCAAEGLWEITPKSDAALQKGL